jgi:hypothetical protein
MRHNAVDRPIDWQFTSDDARIKLRQLYPVEARKYSDNNRAYTQWLAGEPIATAPATRNRNADTFPTASGCGIGHSRVQRYAVSDIDLFSQNYFIDGGCLIGQQRFLQPILTPFPE